MIINKNTSANRSVIAHKHNKNNWSFPIDDNRTLNGPLEKKSKHKYFLH